MKRITLAERFSKCRCEGQVVAGGVAKTSDTVAAATDSGELLPNEPAALIATSLMTNTSTAQWVTLK